MDIIRLVNCSLLINKFYGYYPKNVRVRAKTFALQDC